MSTPKDKESERQCVECGHNEPGNVYGTDEVACVALVDGGHRVCGHRCTFGPLVATHEFEGHADATTAWCVVPTEGTEHGYCGQPRSAPVHQSAGASGGEGEKFQHSFVQPNPGWGKLCESCKYRSPNLDSDYPCLVFQEKSGTVFTRSDANVERLTPDGRDVTWAAKIGVDFTETCSAFATKDSLPVATPTTAPEPTKAACDVSCKNCGGLLDPRGDRHFDGSYYCTDNRTHAEVATQEDSLFTEVEQLKDAVVDTAVAWHQSGREGDDTWLDKSEVLERAIDNLLAVREPSYVAAIPAPTDDPDSVQARGLDAERMPVAPKVEGAAVCGMDRAAEMADEQAVNFRRLRDEYLASDDGNEIHYAKHECEQSIFVLTEFAKMLRVNASVRTPTVGEEEATIAIPEEGVPEELWLRVGVAQVIEMREAIERAHKIQGDAVIDAHLLSVEVECAASRGQQREGSRCLRAFGNGARCLPSARPRCLVV